jgi:predicted Rossmann fold nucleotide-binding protein DprA/Smf involved in DNA uptake
MVGRGGYSSELLSPGEYNRLARILHDNQREPADLLGPDASELLTQFHGIIDSGRLMRLLGRGFLLSQAIERWHARSIWVVSRADPDYPSRLKTRLKDAAPAVFYGCGDAAILESGGLAIVGSRHVDDVIVEYTESIGRLTAEARKTVVSGGARGIDQAAMRGALQAGGRVIGALADSLERLALARDNREFLMNERLVLISAHDPAAGFDIGHAMQRNKIIYALADAALVVSSDYESGGTWAGAIEQLEHLRLVPVYVRSNGDIGKGLKALLGKGALPWPNPSSPEAFAEALSIQVSTARGASGQKELPLTMSNEPAKPFEFVPTIAIQAPKPLLEQVAPPWVTPEDKLFAKVREIIREMKMPKTIDEVATDLNVSKSQARQWLQRLVQEGVLQRKQRPLRFFSASNNQKNLFDT